jgi:antitoxin (DNA-binding transcriptional repressor) of toxin-antitoxin stability system
MSARKTIGIRELKNDLSRIVTEIAETRGEYVVTSRDQPKAVLRAWGPEDEKEKRAAKAAEMIKQIRKLAREVAAAAVTNESAVELVSKQRR